MSDEETIEEAIRRMEGEVVKHASIECGGAFDGVVVVRVETENVHFELDDGDVFVRFNRGE